MRKLPILSILVVGAALLSCSGAQAIGRVPDAVGKLQTSVQLLRVNDYEFMFNDRPGSNITFTIPSASECTLTFAKSSLAKNFTATTQAAEVPQLDLSCLTDSGLFILDETKQTFASMKVVELSAEKASIIVDGYLYAVRKKEYLKLDKVVLNLGGNELKALAN